MAAGTFSLACHYPMAYGEAETDLVGLEEANPAQGRPNVVFIMSDNHGAWQLGSYGNSDIHSPNIDKLAKDGIRFTRAIRTDRWKYVWRYQQPDDLFDLKNDPGELQNIAEDSSHQDVVAGLKKQLEAFF